MLSLKKKGLVASVAALAMAVGGLGIGAGVANATQDPAVATTVAITNAGKGHTYTFYKIGDYASIDANNVAVVKTSTQANDLMKDAAATSDPVQTPTGDDAVAWAATLGTGSAALRELTNAAEKSSKLGALTAAETITVAPDGTAKNAAGASVDLSAVPLSEQGWYLIKDDYKDAKGVAQNGVGALVGTPGGTDNSITKVKNQTLGTVDVKPDDTTPGNPNASPKKTFTGSLSDDATSKASGDFKLTANGPIFSPDINYTSYEYSFIDTPTNLSIDAKSIKVMIADKDVTDQVKVTPAGDTLTGPFTINMDDYFTALAKGDKTNGVKIVVSYTGKATGPDASNSFEINDNGHKVPGGNTGKHPGVTDVSFMKVKEDGKSPLAGATFTLTPVDDPDTALDESATPTATITTGDDGIVDFKNVGDGDYTIAETGTPDGYIAAPGLKMTVHVDQNKTLDDTTDDSVTFADGGNTAMLNVTDPDGDGTSTNGVKTASVNATGVDAYLKNVKNLAQLPLTGAYGIILFMVLAVVLAGGATVMVTVSKRNKKNALSI